MDTAISPPREIAGLSELAGSYRVLLCDVWGVLHNGERAHADAVEALIAFRRAGGIVLLISNAPRPGAAVDDQLVKFGVDLECRDGIITSGDAAHAYVAERPGAKIYHLGPAWDHFIYEDLPVRLVGLDEADYVGCVGLVDDRTETVADYEPLLQAMAERDLTMLCANPDLVVERGSQIVPCAGALAARYEELGGKAVIVGKPHRPIYQQAMARIAELAGRSVEPDEVLAIGDGIGTDLIGANSFGLDVLFVATGIHAGDHQSGEAEAVGRLLASKGASATAFTHRLRW